MTKLRYLAAAAVLAAPAAMAQTYYVERIPAPYYTERITVYEHPRYQDFVARESGALQSGGVSIEDTLLADNVAMAIANDPVLDDATVTVAAHNGRVALNGSADQEQSERARQIAQRIAGWGNVSGELSNTHG